MVSLNIVGDEHIFFRDNYTIVYSISNVFDDNRIINTNRNGYTVVYQYIILAVV